jgi:hypothetical protein
MSPTTLKFVIQNGTLDSCVRIWTVWTLNCTKDKWSPWKQAILFCSILRHISNVWQVTTLSPSELFHFTQILSAEQTLFHESWIWVHRTVLSQSWCTPGQRARVTVIPAIHCRLANFNRTTTTTLATDSDPDITSQKLQTNLHAMQKWLNRWRIKANESSCNAKMVNEMQDKSEWIPIGPCHIHHTKSNLPTSLYKQNTPSSTRRCQASSVALRQETYLAQTHICKMEVTGNDAHQNALATWTKVKSLHNQQNSHIENNTQTSLDLRNTTVGYGFHFKHRNPRTLSI